MLEFLIWDDYGMCGSVKNKAAANDYSHLLIVRSINCLKIEENCPSQFSRAQVDVFGFARFGQPKPKHIQ